MNPISGDTLLLFVEDDGVKMYILDWYDVSKYSEADDQYAGLIDTPNRIEDLIEHLAYMLGVEPYFGKEIPPYKPGCSNNHCGDLGSTEAPAPWANRVVSGPLVDFKKILRVLRTGWFT
jgi:hypothetical protein